jgi:hypothetical protein
MLTLTRQPRSARWRWLALGAAIATLLTGAIVAARRSAAGAPVTVAVPIVVRPTQLVTVQLQSIPSGAEILDERAAHLGTTPYELVVPAGGARQVRFQKLGFHSIDRRFEALTDTTIAVRLDPEARDRHGVTRASGPARLNGTATIDPFGQPAR